MILICLLMIISPAILFAQDATSAPSMQDKTGILDFPGKLNYHKIAGWTSTGLLFTAGVIGVVRAVDLMNRGHQVRDTLGIDENDTAAIATALSSVYEGNQTLRWLHVGFLAAGETLYLGNAVTGISMKLPADERTLSSDIHFKAFIAHAVLMAGEVVLGFMTSDALKRGDHQEHLLLASAHAAIGITIPIVMGAAGWATSADLSFLKKE